MRKPRVHLRRKSFELERWLRLRRRLLPLYRAVCGCCRMWSAVAHQSAASVRLMAAGAKNTPGSWETVSMAAVAMVTARLHVKRWLSRDPAGIHPHTHAHTLAGRLSSRGKIIWVDLGSNDPGQTAGAVLVLLLSTWMVKFHSSRLHCNFTRFFFEYYPSVFGQKSNSYLLSILSYIHPSILYFLFPCRRGLESVPAVW